MLPLVTFPLVYFLKGEKADDEMWVAIGVLCFFIMLGILTIFSVLRTGRKNPGTLETLTRYGVASLSLSKQVEVQKYSERYLMVILHGVKHKAEFQTFNILMFQQFSKFAYCKKRVQDTTRRIAKTSEKRQKNLIFRALFFSRTC